MLNDWAVTSFKRRCYIYGLCLLFLTIQTVSFVNDESVPDPLFYSRFFCLTLIFCMVIFLCSILLIWNRGAGSFICFGYIDIFSWGYAAYLIYKGVCGIYSDSSLPIITGLLVVPVLKQMIIGGLRSSRSLSTVLMFLLSFSLMCQASLGLLQSMEKVKSFHSGFKMTGTFHNPGPLGIWIVVVMPALAFCLCHARSLLLKILYSFFFFLGCFVLVLSDSRTAWLAGLVSVFYMYRVYFYNFIVQHRTRLYIFIASLLPILLVFAYYLYTYKPESALGRVFIWKTGAMMMREHLFSGNGIGGFERAFGTFLARYFSDHSINNIEILLSERTRFAFNDFLQIGVEQGIVGLTFFIAILVSAFQTKRNNRNSLAGFAKISLSGFTFSCLFSYPCETPALWAVFILILGIISSENNYWQIRLSQRGSLFIGGVAAILVSAIIIFQVNIYVFKKEAKRAILLLESNQCREAVLHFEHCYSLLKYDHNIVLPYAKALCNTGEYKKSIDVITSAAGIIADPFMYITKGTCYDQLGDFRNAEEAYKYATLIEPKLMYPKYLLAKLYIKYNDRSNACLYARRVLDMKVKIASEASKQMQAEMIGICAGL